MTVHVHVALNPQNRSLKSFRDARWILKEPTVTDVSNATWSEIEILSNVSPICYRDRSGSLRLTRCSPSTGHPGDTHDVHAYVVSDEVRLSNSNVDGEYVPLCRPACPLCRLNIQHSELPPANRQPSLFHPTRAMTYFKATVLPVDRRWMDAKRK